MCKNEDTSIKKQFSTIGLTLIVLKICRFYQNITTSIVVFNCFLFLFNPLTRLWSQFSPCIHYQTLTLICTINAFTKVSAYHGCMLSQNVLSLFIPMLPKFVFTLPADFSTQFEFFLTSWLSRSVRTK